MERAEQPRPERAAGSERAATPERAAASEPVGVPGAAATPEPAAASAPALASEQAAERPNRLALAYLLLTAVSCGALVMVIEVLGSRVVGPLYGVSLFVWTSLITVTLVALAAGYALGGVMADRRGTADALYSIILTAGVSVLLIPLAKGFVLTSCVPLGLRWGALVSSLLLFGPSLFFLGCVSPYLVKIAKPEVEKIGRTVGGFYALSTLGSVVGTLVTGFFLIAAMGVDRIFQLIGCLLLALAAGHFLLVRRRWLTVALVFVPLFFLPGKRATSWTQPDGTRVSLVDAKDGYYGSVKVVDYVNQGKQLRELIIDGLIQGGVDPRSGQSIYAYSYFLELIPRALHPAGKTCLVVGLGAGIIPRWYEATGVRTDVVDINPDVVAMAREHFGFTNTGRVYLQDARTFLRQSEERYDYLILDVFNGDTTPGHLLSREALALIEPRITERGVLGLNLVGSLGREPMMTASVIRSLQVLFDQVEIYPTFDPKKGDGMGNLAVVAYRGPPRSFSPTAVLGRIRLHPMVTREVNRYLGRRFTFPEGTPTIELTDDYNPIDVRDAWLREAVRQGIIKGTRWELLLGTG